MTHARPDAGRIFQHLQADRDTQRTLAALLLIGACWFAAWPYMGLWHDSRLYALEALARLTPGIFVRDVFLAHGSQGGFTLFPNVFGGLIEWLGLEYAAYSLALVGKLLWFAALAFLARQFIPAPNWFFACLLVLAFPAFYDSPKIFSYGESFATPRLFAEALAMLALAVWARGRHVLAAGLVCAAGASHPLMALPAGVLLLLLARAEFGWRRFAWIALGGLAVLAAGVAVSPDLAKRLISTYDPAWHQAIRTLNPSVFLDSWNLAAFDRMAWIALLLVLVAREGEGLQRRLARAMLLTAMGLLALSWLGAVVWNNILLTQLQLWRVLWLAQVLALLLFAPLLLKSWKSGYPGKMLASCLVAAYVLGPDWMFLGALAGVGLRSMFGRIESGIDPGALPWRVLPYLIVLPWLMLHVLETPNWVATHQLFTDRSAWRVILADRVVLVLVGMAAYWGATRAGRHARKLVFVLSGVACLVAAWGWQPQSVGGKLPEIDRIFMQMQQDIPAGAVVQSAVGAEVGAVWFVLGRASYINKLQTAGALFSRDNALEGIRRMRLLGQAGFFGGLVERKGKAPAPRVHVTMESVKLLCSDAELDYVVLGGDWARAQHRYHSGSRKVSLFACRDVRQAVGD